MRSSKRQHAPCQQYVDTYVRNLLAGISARSQLPSHPIRKLRPRESHSSPCRSKVKSSSCSKVESSGPGRASWRDEPTGAVINEPERTGSFEGFARSGEGAVAPEAGGGAVGADGSLGTEVAGAAAGGRRPGGGPSIARPAVEPEAAGSVAGAGGSPGASGLPGLWPDAGRGVLGAIRRDFDQPGDAAAMVDRGG